ncbi:MAG: hypothetical protein CL946_07590 [Ectothiorhodospiraceae bacterium]|nr:hypothetical protein [Ectothiorhodospiraceae bacterium]
MRYLYTVAVALLLVGAQSGFATTHIITNSGFTFSPDDITINVGDTVTWNIGGAHNVVEVSQATWNSNGNTPLSGGFSHGFGGGTTVFSTAGTHWYVCSPHASSGMKGKITVVQTTISTNALAQSSYCKGANLTVGFTATGSFGGGNTFTAQLSDENGSFASPTSIGSVNGTSSGDISATIPLNAADGTAYRIRVVSSSPVITGTDNGSDLTIASTPSATITPAGPTSFCEGSDVQLDANTGAGLTYTWKRNGVNIPGATNPSYTASEGGSYTVEVSNGTCSKTSSAVVVTVFDGDPSSLTWTAGVDTDWSTVGNWDSPCAVPAAGDTVMIPSGTTPPQNIPNIELRRFVLDNASGLTLTNDLEITSQLVLTNGKITLGSSNLTIGQFASISGAGSSTYIVTNGTGELRMAGIGSGGKTGNILFPVGSDQNEYTPIMFANSGTADQFGVRVADDVLDGGTSGNPVSTDVVDKTWFISEIIPGSSNATITFMWNLAEELAGFDRTMCFVAHHDGTDWLSLQNPGAASGSPVVQRTVSGVTSFSPFAIGDEQSGLPVEYRTFSANVDDDRVVLLWETESETNNAGFEVQRTSQNVEDWQALGFVPANASAQYRYDDAPPAAGGYMYRLRQVDTDGSYEFSPIVSVQMDAAASVLEIESAYPNPVQAAQAGNVTLTFSAPEAAHTEIALYNLLGERMAVVYDGIARQGRNTVVTNLADVPPGTYMYRLNQAGSVVYRQVVLLP